MPTTARPLRAIAATLTALMLCALAGCGGGGGGTGGGGSSSSGGSSSGGTTGSAALSWTAPTTNSDGSSLADLAGYHVYYGTSADLLNQNVPVNDANATSAVVSNLATGTWYFAVTAVNGAGVESDLSNTASKTIN